MRWYQGYKVPFLNVFDAEVGRDEVELGQTRRMPITPDVIRT